MNPVSFAAKMQAALDKRRRATTQDERDVAIKEIESISKGQISSPTVPQRIKPMPEAFDARKAQAGDRE